MMENHLRGQPVRSKKDQSAFPSRALTTAWLVGVFSKFGELPAIIITSPADERLIADDVESNSSDQSSLRARAKVWARYEIAHVESCFEGQSVPLRQVSGSNVWESTFFIPKVSAGVHPLRVVVTDVKGKTAEDEIRVLAGSDRPARERMERDQDNALKAWPEHGLLGTQLGPNKNGRKW